MTDPQQHVGLDEESDADENGEDELCDVQPIDALSSSDEDDDTPIANYRVILQHTSDDANTFSSHQASPPFTASSSTFEPLVIEDCRSVPNGHPNMLALRGLSLSPFVLFNKFMPTSILQQIADNTNAYAQLKRGDGGRPWREVDVNELKCFVGLCIYFGVYKSPRLEDYWDRSGKGPVHAITKSMSLLRLQQIKRFFHICDASGDNGSSFFSTRSSL